jgi:serine/threonine-protein kinase
MELVEGADLAQRIAADGPIPLDDTLAIARQLVDALDSAHEQGIVHRDLKPSNITVTAAGTVKVLDFGLAKALEAPRGSVHASLSPTITTPAQMTHAGVVLGTAAYMSPEQAKGKPIDKRADIWAFGCVLFEMLTGRAVFAADTVTETLAAVMRDAPPLDRLPAGTPPRITRLIARCLERDPKQRLRDIGDARLELADSDREPAAARRRRVGRGGPRRSRPRRRPCWSRRSPPRSSGGSHRRRVERCASWTSRSTATTRSSRPTAHESRSSPATTSSCASSRPPSRATSAR